MTRIIKSIPHAIMAAAYGCELMHMPPDTAAIAMTVAYSAMVLHNLAELILKR